MSEVAVALPLVDEHITAVAASADDVWASLLDVIDAALSRRAAATYARAVGCADIEMSGSRPLTEGATIPGFRVTTAIPGRLLVLEGRHRFSIYALTFHLRPLSGDRSELRAETWATFPRRLGRAYALIVIGSGGHRMAVRRLLASVRRRAHDRQHHVTP